MATVKKNKTGERINEQISSREIRVIDADGNQLGILSRREALLMAKDLGLDLVEISPNAVPPVARIMDYGKYIYAEQKKKKQQQRAPKLKEIKLRHVTEDGDYRVKLRNLISFLEDGDKVKVSIRFRGREIAHHELATKLMQKICVDVEAFGVIDAMPKMEGRQMIMMISPKKKSSQKINQDKEEQK